MARKGEAQWTPPSNPWVFDWPGGDGAPASGGPANGNVNMDSKETELLPVLNGINVKCNSNWMHLSTYDQDKVFIAQKRFLSSVTVSPDEATYFSISMYLKVRTVTITWL